MYFEQAKAKAEARLAWVADHPDYEGEGDKVIAALLKQLADHEVAALAEIDRLLDKENQLTVERDRYKTALEQIANDPQWQTHYLVMIAAEAVRP